jgi:hypothetical protein
MTDVQGTPASLELASNSVEMHIIYRMHHLDGELQLNVKQGYVQVDKLDDPHAEAE